MRGNARFIRFLEVTDASTGTGEKKFRLLSRSPVVAGFESEVKEWFLTFICHKTAGGCSLKTKKMPRDTNENNQVLIKIALATYVATTYYV